MALVDTEAAVAAAAGAPAHEVVFVGDSVTDDVIAAQAAGMRAVWVNRAYRTLPAGVVPDSVVTSLAELPAALTALPDNAGQEWRRVS